MNNLLCEVKNNIGLVTINRPQSLNALNPETLEELYACFEDLADNDELVGVIITGAGERAFVAGADISAMQDFTALEGRKLGRL
ncbi:MAG: enoyl-CoA hydratase-related protein, partial [Desulfofustis sp.]